ncbi:MAG: protein-ADP-ribose hydrolase [Lachnospiraceae bacterium]|nr:protein-ADP-ribose hydrolase [Lachnospiraceae bacterium]
MTQQERRVFMIKELLKEEIRYKGMEIPTEEKAQREMLRSLVNVRPPRPVSEEFLRVEGEYLEERLHRLGVIDADALEPVASDDRLVLWQGDMSRLKCGAVVNPANAAMLGCFQPLHACLDNVIHTFAGVELRAACDRQMKAIRAKLGENYLQPTAIPMMTDAYHLPAEKIIHIVGPIVEGALTEEHRTQLAACYRNTLILCDRGKVTSVAFCCISTGVFQFPREEAAEIAVKTVRAYLDGGSGVRRVVFDVFTDEDLEIYERVLGEKDG